jgi:hypothetical protein
MPRRELPGTRLREIVAPDDPALGPAYDLLTAAFDPEERVPISDWSASLSEKSHSLLADTAWHLVVATQNGSVVGLISGTYLGNVNVGVIGYLAITPAARAQGIGTRLRNRLRHLFDRDAVRISRRPLDAIIGEVSNSNRWIRTLARRPNVLVLDFPYFQPRLSEEHRQLQFHLYYESLQRTRRSLPAGELKKILYAIWRRVYRVPRPLHRAGFRTMLAALEGRRTIPGLKLVGGRA